MRIRTALAAPIAVAALSVFVVGCGSSDEPTAQSSDDRNASSSDTGETDADDGSASDIAAGDGSFDICTALKVEDVTPEYIPETLLPVTFLQKSIVVDRYEGDRNGVATCSFGTVDDAGILIGVPLAAEQRDLKALATIASGGEPKETKVGSDKAFVSVSERNTHVAVQHGENQFMLGWKQTGFEQISAEQIVALAAKITAKMPTEASFKRTATVEECEGLDPSKIVGKTVVSQGSAGDNFLNCAFSGPKGTITLEATKSRNAKTLKQSTTITREGRPELEIKPAMDPDTTMFQSSRTTDGLSVAGQSTDCCELDVKFVPRKDSNSRGEEIDQDERKLLTEFVETARDWGV